MGTGRIVQFEIAGPEPWESTVKLEAHPDRTLIRAVGSSVRYIRVSLTAPPSTSRPKRWPVHLALVLDRSGSMGGRKIALARDAVAQTLRLLGPDDQFALVVYDNEVSLLSASVSATPEAKQRALELLARVDARGSTDLSGGWLQGTEQLLKTPSADAIGICFLLSDGLANHGITDRAQLVSMAGDLQARGVCTSTFGVGNDFDEGLLRAMAEASSGNFHYIEAPEQIPELLTRELGEKLEVVARDVALEVALAPGVSAEPLTRLPWEQSRGQLRVQLGHLVSNQEVELVIKLLFPSGEAGRQVATTLSVAHPEVGANKSAEEVRWTWAGQEENDHQAPNREVDWAVATLYAGRVREEAVERSREGDLEGARRVLRATARCIRRYAGDEPRLRTLVAQLEAEAEEYGARPFTTREIRMAIYADYVAA